MVESVLYGALFLTSAVLLTLGAYFLMRKIMGAEQETHTKDLASSIIIRVSGLHGLILALVFAQEMIDYQQLKYESAIETNAVADVYFDAERYGKEAKLPIQEPLFAYVNEVVHKEWDHLGQTGRLTGQGWADWDKAYSGILDLVPVNDRQKALRDHMLSQIHVVAETRVKRENHSATSVSMMFWFAAISGVIIIAIAYFTFPPTRRNVVLLGLFGAFTGLILFFIYAFENPFSAPGRIDPAAHLRLLAQLEDFRSR